MVATLLFSGKLKPQARYFGGASGRQLCLTTGQEEREWEKIVNGVTLWIW